MTARVDRLIARLRALDGTVAVFSHGHLGRVLVARWIDLPLPEGQRFSLGTASVSVLGMEHDLPLIVQWNT
jgi:probable phosphoglycerate mutase